jgi:hypothetical protein
MGNMFFRNGKYRANDQFRLCSISVLRFFCLYVMLIESLEYSREAVQLAKTVQVKKDE